MEKTKKILIVCGEASGDLNAAGIAAAILKIEPQTKISAVGGEKLRKSGAEVFYNIKNLSVMGLFDVFKKLPEFFALKKLILQKIETEKPNTIILIDFSGFNLRLAKSINKKIPVIYYVSPQVWASRQGRVETIKKYVDKMVVLFKFEEEFYKKYGVDASFCGHPLLDIVKPTIEKEEFLKSAGLSPAKTIIALLPGSRKQEIKNILPIMLRSAMLIKEKITGVEFVIAKSPNVGQNIYDTIITECIPSCHSEAKAKNLNNKEIILKIIERKTYDCLNAADFCLVASGTATLETAIMQKPFAVIYKMNLLNYLLYRPQVKIPYICIVNILAGKRIIPEFIQFQAIPKKIAEYTAEIMQNKTKLQQIKNDLSQVVSSLGQSGASLRAAETILNFLNK